MNILPPSSSHFFSVPSDLTEQLSTFIQKEFNVEKQRSRELAEVIKNTQNKASTLKYEILKPVTDFQYTTLVSESKILFKCKQLGKGGDGTVDLVTVFPTQRADIGSEHFSPYKKKNYALKTGNENVNFEEEQRLLEKINPEGKQCIIRIIETKRSSNGTSHALLPLSKGSLEAIIYTEILNPVEGILSYLQDTAEAIELFHKEEYVHRDIKGANVLINTDEVDERKIKRGVLTDFNTVRKEENTLHKTRGTPDYLSPDMFGSPKSRLPNLRRRLGIQTKEGDIFALGTTIYLDILNKFVMDYKNKYLVNDPRANELLKSLKITNLVGSFSDQMLSGISKKERYISHRYDRQNNKDIIKIFPELDIIERSLFDLFDLLSDQLTSKEIETLKQLTTLSCKLRQFPAQNRPTIAQVREELRSIQRSFKAKVLGKRKWGVTYREYEIDKRVKTDNDQLSTSSIDYVNMPTRPVLTSTSTLTSVIDHSNGPTQPVSTSTSTLTSDIDHLNSPTQPVTTSTLIINDFNSLTLYASDDDIENKDTSLVWNGDLFYEYGDDLEDNDNQMIDEQENTPPPPATPPATQRATQPETRPATQPVRNTTRNFRSARALVF